MGYYLDQKHENVIFLYKLKEGSCSKSFGLNVAKIVGIPEKVILKAQSKADEFENNLFPEKTCLSNLSTLLANQDKDISNEILLQLSNFINN